MAVQPSRSCWVTDMMSRPISLPGTSLLYVNMDFPSILSQDKILLLYTSITGSDPRFLILMASRVNKGPTARHPERASLLSEGRPLE
ncbi:hypothetical protein CHELA1G11_20805 [Hyphomicrobiales bacterium]|nr:hypothetical protein CHELA1G11_20805 [Hyphomicrobiales bacterium]CAH1692024.1 hypothetical protein CHELA1G2_21120 [Hyphomicrobiales bacterium]